MQSKETDRHRSSRDATGEPISSAEHRTDSSLLKTCIDTLAIAHKLKDAGIVWKHAQVHAKVIADSVEKQQLDLATKDFVTSQIQTVRAEIGDLRADMNSMEGNLRAEMKAQETRLVRWIVGAFVGIAGLLLAALNSPFG